MTRRDKRERKMTPEQLEELTYMRKRGFVQKNGKAYSRKEKHKKKEDVQYEQIRRTYSNH